MGIFGPHGRLADVRPLPPFVDRLGQAPVLLDRDLSAGRSPRPARASQRQSVALGPSAFVELRISEGPFLESERKRVEGGCDYPDRSTWLPTGAR